MKKNGIKRADGKIDVYQLPEDYPQYLAGKNNIRLLHKHQKLWSEDIVENHIPFDGSAEVIEILDIGCGTGHIAEHIVKNCNKIGKKVKITGIDKLKSMVEFTRKRLKGKNLNIAIIEADAIKIPFEDNTFHTAYGTQIFFCLTKEELLKLFAEVYRVLKPGGKFYFLGHNRNPLVRLAAYYTTRKGQKGYEMDSLKYNYKPKEFKIMIKKSPLWNGNTVIKSKLFSLLVESYGTINKT